MKKLLVILLLASISSVYAGGHHSHGGGKVAYGVGGLFLGATVASAWYAPRYVSAPVYYPVFIPAPTPVFTPSPSPVYTEQSQISADVALRLARAQDLYNRGLISQPEYQFTREQILRGL